MNAPRRMAQGIARAIVAVFIPLGLALAPLPALAAEPLEYAVKAAYLYKLGLFVEWPATAFATPASPLNLCVVGEDPFGPLLDTAVRDQRVGGRPIAVLRMKSVGREAGCHILYIGNAEAPRSGQIAEAVRGSRVLTVTDGRGGVPGIVHFVLKDNRVRFDIDDEAAAQNGLTISSKLLSLALNVKPRGGR